MPFDSLTLAAVAREITESLTGDRVNTVTQPEPLIITLTFSRKQKLLISAQPDYARIHLASHDSPRPPQPPGFCMLLRKYLEGARLRAVRQPHFDRVLEMEFHHGEDHPVLIAELMGRHSNLLLCTPDSLIRGLIKPMPAAVNRYRELLPNALYIPPPLGDRSSPLEGAIEEAIHRVYQSGAGKPLSTALAASWTGMSVALVAWIARQVGTTLDAPLDQSLILPLEAALTRLREVIHSGRYLPSASGGTKSDVWALPLPTGESLSEQMPAPTGLATPSISRLVENVFEDRIASRDLENLRSRSAGVLKHEITRETRKLEDFNRVQAEAHRVEEFREWGQALLTFSSLVSAGSTLARLPNPCGGDEELEIPLDADLTAIENAESYFTRARRSERAARHVLAMAGAARKKLEVLQQILNEISLSASAEQIGEALAAIPGEWGLHDLERLRGDGSSQAPGLQKAGKEKAAGHPSKGEAALPSGVRRVLATSGHEILFGRSSTDNDFLTTRIARPNDIWLHARGETSAHVVIRTNNQPDRVPRETLLEAANVAAIHSASKHSSYVAVDYTLRKYVVKRRGAPPGTVEYREEKTLHVQPRLD